MKKWYDEEYEFTVEVTSLLHSDTTEHYCRNGEEVGDKYTCTYGCPVNKDGYGICSKAMMMLYPLMEAVRSGGDLENLGGDGKYSKTIVCPDGCVMFKLTATPLGNENFHKGGFWTYPDETVLILKYTMSGYSIHHHWLSLGQRGSIYNAFLIFAKENMEHLSSLGYDARIGAICWMQGESDTTQAKADRYFDNQSAFVSYLREDLEPYAEDGGIYFIDAGISNGPYCEPGYPTVNEAKRRFSELSPLNIYFSTIDAGLTTVNEPEGDPDWGHYDALCELELGRIFAKHVIESYRER